LPAKSVLAQAISVSATVVGTSQVPGSPIVQFSGYASPQAVVKIARQGKTVATRTATAAAWFEIVIADQPTGDQIYDITAEDTRGLTHAPITFALNMKSGVTTIVSGVFLGPSIGIDKAAVRIGQSVTVSGSTAPNATVGLMLNPAVNSGYQAVSNEIGRWSKTIDTGNLTVGNYSISAQAVINGDQASIPSSSVSFSVNPLGVVDTRSSADFNTDNKVDLIDFSVMLFYWGTTRSGATRVDLNKDGLVDVVDFSIMLYQWTG
jgi:hypothetical protein